MSTIALPAVPASLPRPEEIRLRWMELGLVLFVALSEPIYGSALFALHGGSPRASGQVGGGLLRELGALAVLLYVLQRRSRTLFYFGKRPEWKDIPRGLALCAAGFVIMSAASYIYSFGYALKTGHLPAALPVSKALGMEKNSTWFLYILLSPVSEELIVRGFLITEIAALMNLPMAILASTVLQISYHAYQGVTNLVTIATLFLLFSLYYGKTNRLMPVILAHLMQDLYAFLRLHG